MCRPAHVCRAKADEPKETSSAGDSYSVRLFFCTDKLSLLSLQCHQCCLATPAAHTVNWLVQKIEAPVRDTIPDGGKPVEQRTLGQESLDKELQASITSLALVLQLSQLSLTCVSPAERSVEP